MLAEFYDPEDEQKLAVATAVWDGADVTITATDAEIRERLAGAFRRSSVATPALPTGRPGAGVVQPGSLEWFRAVAATRAFRETGLAARFVATTVVGGYDPAAGYRPFDEQVERLADRTRG